MLKMAKNAVRREFVPDRGNYRTVKRATQASKPVMTKRKVEIQIETERVCVVRHRKSQVADCLLCGDQTVMISLDEAVVSSGMSVRQLCHQIEVEELGFSEQANGLLLVCSRCLRRLNSPPKQLPETTGR